jgi:alanyl-tRNA synthetase
MHPLPKPSVDTGMGLERISAVMQGVHSNYEIDLFQHLIKAAARETSTTDLNSPSLKVIADHIRACAFLIVDGVIPGNEGRGYVLRRIIRRALRHGHKLGQSEPFFYRLVDALAEIMGNAYPELLQASSRVADTLLQEEIRFGETLQHGMALLEDALSSQTTTLDGGVAFKLYDTYGFPLDLTADVCRERGVSVDEAGFNHAMAHQREQARAAGKFKAADTLEYSGKPTDFYGYDSLNVDDARVTALYVDGSPVNEIQAGQPAVVVLDKTPFYAESGGQIGDSGVFEHEGMRFEIADTQKIRHDVYGHHGTLVSGRIKLGELLSARVDGIRRARTMRNHSATHLMHKALREVLGDHVQQKGSLVDPDKTRFDFSHGKPVTSEQIRDIELKVNAEILLNQETQARVMPMDAARKLGAVMLFGEKYGSEVRVLDIGSSRELCGGTHVRRTGDIGLFKIVSESGVASGIRRIEAVTGDNTLTYLQDTESCNQQAAAALKTTPAELPLKIAQIQEHVRLLEKELEQLKSRLAANQGDHLISKTVDVDGIKVLAAKMDDADPKTLRETADRLRDKLKSCVLVLGSTHAGKVSLIAAVSPDLISRIQAGALVNHVAQQVGGKGGGKPELAQAGGTRPESLADALAGVKAWVSGLLAR